MFAVLYQSYLKPGCEAEYQQAWHKIACYFREHRGAIGSCLHQTKEGLWIAYSRWPDKATRDASWPDTKTPSQELPKEIRKDILVLIECLDQNHKFPELCMEVVDDLLFKTN